MNRNSYLLLGILLLFVSILKYFNNYIGIIGFDFIFIYSLLSIACELWELNNKEKETSK